MKDTTWGTPLHAGESVLVAKGHTKVNERKKAAEVGDYYGPSRMIDVLEVHTQGTLSSTVLLLQGDLNKEIKRANVRRKADTEATKAAISKMEDDVNWRFDGNDVILK